MSVNHCGAHILMPQQFLNSTDVITGLQQVSRKAVAEGMAATGLMDVGLSDRLLDGPL
jgi:hypothetical protein